MALRSTPRVAGCVRPRAAGRLARRESHRDEENGQHDDRTTSETSWPQNFPLSDEGSELAGSDSLIEAGVIDSTGVLELIEFLEATYEFQIADEEGLPDNLD